LALLASEGDDVVELLTLDVFTSPTFDIQLVHDDDARFSYSGHCIFCQLIFVASLHGDVFPGRELWVCT
jgi:hypothetical protein